MLVEVLAAATSVGIYKYLFPGDKTRIKRLLQKLFQEKKILNSKGYYPKIKAIELKPYGAIATLDIKGVCSFQDLEKHENYLKTLLGAKTVEINYKGDLVEVQLILSAIQDLQYQKVNLNSHELLLGHDYKGTPIVANMKKTPHILTSGLSNTGKSFLIKTIIKNLDTKVLMFNAFQEDYKDLDNIIHIQEEELILKKLQDILNNKSYRPKPLYVFIEELSTIKNKKIIQTIKELLCVARHFNVFILGITQIATKEELMCKSYFNTRISFKQIDSSSYQVALGFNPGDPLQNREFYVVSDGFYRGRTYNLTETV